MFGTIFMIGTVLLLLGAYIFFNHQANKESKRTQRFFEEKQKDWWKIVDQGKCGRCRREFTIHNPHSAGGMCRDCWANSQC